MTGAGGTRRETELTRQTAGSISITSGISLTRRGYMKTGWISWEDKLYYCDPSGAMLVSAVTPDGFTVGADGARIN